MRISNNDYKQRTHNVIVLDAHKLGKLIADNLHGAREVNVDLGDFEKIWIAKFSSIISQESSRAQVTPFQNFNIL